MAITFTAYAKNNGAYKTNKAMPNNTPMGIIVHSTGVNNPNLKRYVNELSTLCQQLSDRITALENKK